jgi:hypothetical protein
LTGWPAPATGSPHLARAGQVPARERTIQQPRSGHDDDNFPIIDPHHHLWDLEHYRYPWLQDGVAPIVFGDYEPIRKSYLIENFLDGGREARIDLDRPLERDNCPLVLLLYP